jgi:hypothetical protein
VWLPVAIGSPFTDEYALLQADASKSPTNV